MTAALSLKIVIETQLGATAVTKAERFSNSADDEGFHFLSTDHIFTHQYNNSVFAFLLSHEMCRADF